MVIATKPGTTVPVRIVRDRQERTVNVTVDELDLEAETQRAARAATAATTAARRRRRSGFGMTLEQHHAGGARSGCGSIDDAQGAVVIDVEPGSPAARAGLAPGDVIVRVGRETVATRGRRAAASSDACRRAAPRSCACCATARRRSSR